MFNNKSSFITLAALMLTINSLQATEITDDFDYEETLYRGTKKVDSLSVRNQASIGSLYVGGNTTTENLTVRGNEIIEGNLIVLGSTNFTTTCSYIVTTTCTCTGGGVSPTQAKAEVYLTGQQHWTFGDPPLTILFNSTVFDPLASYNSGTGVYTVPQAGTYLVVASLQLSSDGPPYFSCTFQIAVNNDNTPTYYSCSAYYDDSGTSSPSTYEITRLVQCNAEDTIQVNVIGGSQGSYINTGSTFAVHLLSSN